MMNKTIRLTTKVATAMAIAGTVVSTMGMSVMAAESDREHVHEAPVYAELVPEAQCIDNFDEIEYINVEGYDPVCRTTYVPEAQVIIGDAPIIPEIISEDESGKIIAQIVPKAQYIDDLNETEYVNRDGNEEIIFQRKSRFKIITTVNYSISCFSACCRLTRNQINAIKSRFLSPSIKTFHHFF